MAEYETRPVVGSATVDQATFDAGLRSHMLRVYNYMASGLALSGIVALRVYSVPALNAIFIKTGMLANGRVVATLTILGWIAILAPIGLILLTAFRASTMSVTTTKAIYWAIVALNGIGFTLLIYRYTGVSLARTFFKIGRAHV